MTKQEVFEAFERHAGEYLKRDRMITLRGFRPDLAAFMTLTMLDVDNRENIIACAEHDKIYLSFSLDRLAPQLDEDVVISLIRCGVVLDSEYGSLFMFV